MKLKIDLYKGSNCYKTVYFGYECDPNEIDYELVFDIVSEVYPKADSCNYQFVRSGDIPVLTINKDLTYHLSDLYGIIEIDLNEEEIFDIIKKKYLVEVSTDYFSTYFIAACEGQLDEEELAKAAKFILQLRMRYFKGNIQIAYEEYEGEFEEDILL